MLAAFFGLLAISGASIVTAQSSSGTSSNAVPACLLGALNSQPDPSKYASICGNATKVESILGSTCGDNLSLAYNHFSSVCRDSGVTVSPYSASKSSSANATASTGSHSGKPISTTVFAIHVFDSSCSCIKTSMVTSMAYAAVATGGSDKQSDTNAADASADAAGDAAAAAATGSSASSTTTGSTSSSTGAAVVGAGLSAGAIVVAGLAMLL